MAEMHLVHILFLQQCLKLYTWNAFDSSVDTVIGIPINAALYAHSCYCKKNKKKKTFNFIHTTCGRSVLSERDSLVRGSQS